MTGREGGREGGRERERERDRGRSPFGNLKKGLTRSRVTTKIPNMQLQCKRYIM